MKRKLWLEVALCAVIAGLLWVVLYGADDAENAVKKWNKQEGFVAHEWGAQVEDTRNPYDMAEDLKGTPASGARGVEAPVMVERAKPVLFFYTVERKEVRVTVSASEGVLKYYYPPAVLHEYFGQENGKSGASALEGYQWFEWPVLALLPVGGASEIKMADVPKGHWWQSCRKVDSSAIEMNYGDIEQNSGVPNGQNSDQRFAEQFLFYDGSSSRATAVEYVLNGDTMTVTNNERYDMQSMFVLHRDAEGMKWGFAAAVKQGKQVAVELVNNAVDFAAAFTREQWKAGLYDDEIASFWAAWEKQFFLNPGTRVLYILPQAVMDEVMPLMIDPKPDKLVRVNWVCLGK